MVLYIGVVIVRKQKTHEEYVSDLQKVNCNIEVLEKYIKASTKILHKCLICGCEWPATPNNILAGGGCPNCALIERSLRQRKSHAVYVNEVKKIHPYISVLEEYKGDRVKILHKCNHCGHIWQVAPGDILQKNGCPVCAHRIIGNPPEYKNSMWASENREFYLMYFTEEQTKLYMPNSTKLLEATCPICGAKRMIKPVNLTRNGMGCVCSDGQSFPNKFVYNVLTQLDLNVIPEYSPKWANKRRYDDYIPEYNMIIENNGKQHYDYSRTFHYKALEEQQQIDAEKEAMALSHGIKKYIVLNCYNADKDWIKKSIMKSDLPKILGFSENDIDWEMAMQFATTSIAKQIADMFNNNLSIKEISKKLKINCTTTRCYLKKATMFGWCQYSPKEKQKVFCPELNITFDSICAASRDTGATTAGIIRCCQGKQAYAGIHPSTGAELHWAYVKA